MNTTTTDDGERTNRDAAGAPTQQDRTNRPIDRVRPAGATPDERVALPSTLDTPCSKRVYRYLDVVGEAHVDELKSALGLPLLTLYPVLNSLVDRGLLERQGTTYRARRDRSRARCRATRMNRTR